MVSKRGEKVAACWITFVGHGRKKVEWMRREGFVRPAMCCSSSAFQAGGRKNRRAKRGYHEQADQCGRTHHRSSLGQLFIQPIKQTPSTTTSAAPVSGRPWYVNALSCGAPIVTVPLLPSSIEVDNPRTSWLRYCCRMCACAGVIICAPSRPAFSRRATAVGL